jgi:hypothetical protein
MKIKINNKKAFVDEKMEGTMKRNIFLVGAICLILTLGAYAYAAEMFGARGAHQMSDPSLEQMLTYAIQDEYLARAEYYFIIDKYGSIRPFSNIVQAEEQHVSMLVPLFTKYGFAVPKDTAKEHIIVPDDLKVALETCVQAEVDNIAMYETFLGKSLPDDVRDVFERLKNASGNHLEAFRNALSRY